MDSEYSRDGRIIYEEGVLQVRENILDFNSHYLYIGENSFFLKAGSLEEFAQRTPIGKIEQELQLYDPLIPVVLKKNGFSVDGFQTFLLRVRLEEVEAQLRDSNR